MGRDKGNLGAKQVAIRASVKSMDKIHNTLVNNVSESIHQTTNQLSISSSNINYVDRYGVCDIETDPDSDNYTNVKGKTLYQTSHLETHSKNIINNSINIIMKNEETVNIFNSIKVNRINNVIVFFSLLMNLIWIYLFYKLFKKLFGSSKAKIKPTSSIPFDDFVKIP